MSEAKATAHMALTIVFGGTFDPLHIGHLVLAQEVFEAVGADRILFVPAGKPPHKATKALSDPVHRLAMVRLAIAGDPRFAASEIEIGGNGPSFTIETLRSLRETGAMGEIGLIVGADQALEFETWKEHRALAQEFRVVLTTRASVPLTDERLPECLSGALRVPIPALEISSTDIRRRVREGRSIRYLVSSSVAEHIERHRLYLQGPCESPELRRPHS